MRGEKVSFRACRALRRLRVTDRGLRGRSAFTSQPETRIISLGLRHKTGADMRCNWITGAILLLILMFVSVLVACTRVSSIEPGAYAGSGVDAYISPALSAHDRSVIRNVMLLLRPSQ